MLTTFASFETPENNRVLFLVPGKGLIIVGIAQRRSSQCRTGVKRLYGSLSKHCRCQHGATNTFKVGDSAYAFIES